MFLDDTRLTNRTVYRKQKSCKRYDVNQLKTVYVHSTFCKKYI